MKSKERKMGWDRMKASEVEMKEYKAGKPAKKETVTIELEGGLAVAYRAMIAFANQQERKELANTIFIEGMKIVRQEFSRILKEKEKAETK